MIEIGGLEKSTLIDYPGRVAATVFLLGCNFRCPFCYSSELVLPEKISRQPRILEKVFFDFLKERQGLLDGVVICGGEPTFQKDLPDFIKRIKDLGYLVKLDTNGSNPEILKELMGDELLDYVAMDIKSCREKYDLAAGVRVDIGKIEESIKMLKKGKINYEFRTTVVRTLHTKEDILSLAKWIGGNPSTGSGQGKYYLQNFRAEKTIDPKFEKVKPYPPDFLLEIQKEISPFFEICEVRD